MNQFLSTLYPTDFMKSPVATSEEVASIDVLTSDQEGESDWDLVYLTKNIDKGRRASTCGHYGSLGSRVWLSESRLPRPRRNYYHY